MNVRLETNIATSGNDNLLLSLTTVQHDDSTNLEPADGR